MHELPVDEAYAPPVQPAAPTYPGVQVRRGPRAYRRQIRGLGPVLGLLLPAIVGALALLSLRGNEGSTARGIVGFLLAVLAAPGLLVAGAPLTSGTGTYGVAIAGSAVVWLLLGLTASRRATSRPAATWGDFWREYAWLAGAVWLGVVGALVAANLILGGAFL